MKIKRKNKTGLCIFLILVLLSVLVFALWVSDNYYDSARESVEASDMGDIQDYNTSKVDEELLCINLEKSAIYVYKSNGDIQVAQMLLKKKNGRLKYKSVASIHSYGDEDFKNNINEHYDEIEIKSNVNVYEQITLYSDEINYKNQKYDYKVFSTSLNGVEQKFVITFNER